MNNQPLITIIIPTYNRANLLLFSVKSALQQTYQNIEVVIVDDGSTDDTKFILENIKTDKVRYYYKEHTTAADTRNYGVRKAKSELVLFLDSDDVLLSNALEIIANAHIKDPWVDVIYGNCHIINNTGKTIGEQRFNDIEITEELLPLAIYDSPLFLSGTMVKKKILLEQPFDAEYAVDEDYELWSRWLGLYKFRHINDYILKVRQHKNRLNLTRSNNKCADKILENILKRHEWSKLFPQFNWAIPHNAYALACTEVAKVLIRYRRPERAMFYLSKCDENNRNADAFNIIAVANMSAGKTKQAKENIHKAMVLEPLNMSVLRNAVIIDSSIFSHVLFRCAELLKSYGIKKYAGLCWRWANGMIRQRVYLNNYDYDLNITVKTKVMVYY